MIKDRWEELTDKALDAFDEASAKEPPFNPQTAPILVKDLRTLADEIESVTEIYNMENTK